MADKVRRKAERDPDFANPAWISSGSCARGPSRVRTGPVTGAPARVCRPEHDYWVRASTSYFGASTGRRADQRALDDPLVPPDALSRPLDAAAWDARAEVHAAGRPHAGFIEGRWPRGASPSWAERRAVECPGAAARRSAGAPSSMPSVRADAYGLAVTTGVSSDALERTTGRLEGLLRLGRPGARPFFRAAATDGARARLAPRGRGHLPIPGRKRFVEARESATRARARRLHQTPRERVMSTRSPSWSRQGGVTPRRR